jgi:hypothetical protein
MQDVHHLKTWTPFFRDVKSGIKNFEVRVNDRDYKVGDNLILDEFDPDKETKTGDWIAKRIGYILDDPRFVKEGFVILGLQDINVDGGKKRNG